MAGWTLLAIGTICLGVTVWSGWKRLEVRGTLGGVSRRVVLATGLLGYYVGTAPEPGGIDVSDASRVHVSWWYWWWDTSPKGWSPLRFQCGGPLWPLGAAALLGGAMLVRSGRGAARRTVEGLCARCGYDMRGLDAATRCPECGRGGAT